MIFPHKKNYEEVAWFFSYIISSDFFREVEQLFLMKMLREKQRRKKLPKAITVLSKRGGGGEVQGGVIMITDSMVLFLGQFWPIKKKEKTFTVYYLLFTIYCLMFTGYCFCSLFKK